MTKLVVAFRNFAEVSDKKVVSEGTRGGKRNGKKGTVGGNAKQIVNEAVR
jgi:hypothetical protein